jgi:hypothetical protein
VCVCVCVYIYIYIYVDVRDSSVGIATLLPKTIAFYDYSTLITAALDMLSLNNARLVHLP